MNDDLRVVFESPNRGACADRALVLESLQIPYRIVDDMSSCALVVPAEFSARARDELLLYEEENPPPVIAKPAPVFQHQNALPGILVYAIVVCLIAGMEARGTFSFDWRGAGRVDGVLIRAGEWWRAITALTLHSGLRHLVGNLVFGGLFGLFAGRLLGSGVAWLTILLAGAAGNLLNMLLLDPAHKSIGASTAVFAALGLVAGFVWRGKLMRQDHWAYRLGPIVGGFALLMYTGTGGPNTDVGAHLMGFLCGLLAGVWLAPIRSALANQRLQLHTGWLAIVLIGFAWLVAYLRYNPPTIM